MPRWDHIIEYGHHGKEDSGLYLMGIAFPLLCTLLMRACEQDESSDIIIYTERHEGRQTCRCDPYLSSSFQIVALFSEQDRLCVAGGDTVGHHLHLPGEPLVRLTHAKSQKRPKTHHW